MEAVAETENASFENSFWSPKDNDFLGFDILTKRMKDGKHMYDEVAEFITKRIKIEQSYAKELQNLVKSQKPCTDSGTTKAAWDMLKVEVSRMSTVHMEMATEMKENVLFNVNNFRTKQRDQRKKREEAVIKAQKSKLSAHATTEKLQQRYIKLSKEADKLLEDLDKATKAGLLKDIEKLRTKSKKAKQAAESADSGYKDAVEHLDHCRRAWEREMVQCCKLYQMMEQERLEHQRNALWVVMNISSAVSVEVDKRLEMCRQTLESINVEGDIQGFIKSNAIGSVRPDRVPYINYSTGQPVAVSTDTGYLATDESAQSSLKSSSSLKGTSKAVPPAGISSSPAFRSAVETKPPSSNRRHSLPETTMFKAAFKYLPQGPQEIPLEIGALVKVIGKTDGDWWKATSNGRTGMVPQAYLKPM